MIFTNKIISLISKISTTSGGATAHTASKVIDGMVNNFIIRTNNALQASLMVRLKDAQTGGLLICAALKTRLSHCNYWLSMAGFCMLGVQ